MKRGIKYLHNSLNVLNQKGPDVDDTGPFEY